MKKSKGLSIVLLLLVVAVISILCLLVWKYQAVQGRIVVTKTYPINNKQSTTIETPTKKIDVIDGSIYKVNPSNELKILIDKKDYIAEDINRFDEIMVSPDGTKMCFVGYTSFPAILYYANIDGSGVKKIYANVADSCVWSPDSKNFAFNNRVTDVSPVDIWVYDTVSGKTENLTSNKAPKGFIRLYSIPQWSEDGSSITAKFRSLDVQGELPEKTGTSIINTLTKIIVDK